MHYVRRKHIWTIKGYCENWNRIGEPVSAQIAFSDHVQSNLCPTQIDVLGTWQDSIWFKKIRHKSVWLSTGVHYGDSLSPEICIKVIALIYIKLLSLSAI